MLNDIQLDQINQRRRELGKRELKPNMVRQNTNVGDNWLAFWTNFDHPAGDPPPVNIDDEGVSDPPSQDGGSSGSE